MIKCNECAGKLATGSEYYLDNVKENVMFHCILRKGESLDHINDCYDIVCNTCIDTRKAMEVARDE